MNLSDWLDPIRNCALACAIGVGLAAALVKWWTA
jgi:hypothetical protein